MEFIEALVLPDSHGSAGMGPPVRLLRGRRWGGDDGWSGAAAGGLLCLLRGCGGWGGVAVSAALTEGVVGVPGQLTAQPVAYIAERLRRAGVRRGGE